MENQPSSNYLRGSGSVETGEQIGPSLINEPRALPLGCSFSPDGQKLVFAAFYGGARLVDTPALPAQGLANARLWIEVITRMQMDEQGIVTWLSQDLWRAKSQQLEKLGGPPVR